MQTNDDRAEMRIDRMENVFPLPRQQLLALGPGHLVTYRSARYTGDAMSMDISEFAAPDRALLARLYAHMSELLAILQRNWHTPQQSTAELRAFMQQVNWSALLPSLQQLGDATVTDEHNEMLTKVIHDVRGGGFVALSLYLQLLEMGLEQEEDVPRLFFLTRDHLKIMRNAIRNLDPERQQADSEQLNHSARLLVEKWERAAHKFAGNTAMIMLDCPFAGSIAERCLEFSALDRVIYNLINNAARYSADNRVYFVVLPLPQDAPHDLRFVVYNKITPEHAAKLHAKYPADLGELFRGGFTTGGTGVGLRICADFVNNAYGVSRFDQGLQDRYYGATQINEYFVNWVHWPIAAD